MTQNRAMLCALAAYFLWVVNDTCVKLSSQAALSPFAIMAIMGAVGAVSLAASALIKRETSVLRPRHCRDQAWIAACRIGVNFANIIALKHLPLTLFYVVVFTAPLAIAALSAFLKQETLSPVKIACLIAGFSGTVLAIGVRGGGGDWVGCLAAFASVICFSTGAILMRKTAKTETVESTQFISYLSVGTFGLCGLLLHAQTMPESWVLILMIVAGFFGVLGSVLYNMALHNTVSTNVAQFHYTQIISGALFGYLLWREVPTWNLVAGSLVIIASGLVVATRARKKEVYSTET